MDDLLVPRLLDVLETAVTAAATAPCDRKNFRLCPRDAAVSCYLAPSTASADLGNALSQQDAFSPLLGVSPVKNVARKNGWLLFTLTDAFYDAAMRHVICTLPYPDTDDGCHVQNRMMLLAQKAPAPCPPKKRCSAPYGWPFA